MRKPRKNTPHTRHHSSAIQHRSAPKQAILLIALCLMLPLCLLKRSAFATNTHPIPPPSADPAPLTAQDIETEVSHFMRTYIRDYPKQSGQEISYTIEQLDLRITLNPCETPLVVAPYQRQPTSATSKITLQIACSAPKRWRLFVPVNIQITDRVVVAQVATPRNTTLTANELGYQYLDVSRLRQDYFRDIHAITGYSTRQFLRQGAIVSRHLVTPPRVVHKNQTVTIVATGEHLAVKATGTALSDGKVGDWIRVKNSSSKRIVEGRVTANGSIEITH